MMQRRDACRYVVLGTTCFAGIASKELSLAMSYVSAQTKIKRKWVVLYWMPYDNDLSRFGELIVEMLAHATQKTDVAVLVQSDYLGDPKMRRRQIVDGIITEVDVLGEDSSDSCALAEFLSWSNKNFEAENWAIIVVGHGGRIDEISPDDHEITNQPRTWMKVEQFTDSVNDFNHSVNGRVELLFFQNCNKATLEVVYESQTCAKYTLASQLLLGAPNYYYHGFLHRLASSEDGAEAAMAIMESERVDMFHTLTLIDNQAMKRVPEKLSKLLQPIFSYRSLEIDWSELPIYYYAGERHCDLLALLAHFSKFKNQRNGSFKDFSEFLRLSVIRLHKTGGRFYEHFPRSSIHDNELCGLGLYLPRTRDDIERYSSLSLYQDVDFLRLYKMLFE